MDTGNIINDFFTKQNRVDLPPTLNYENIKEYISILNAISLLTNQSIYIIDYLKQKFLYVSDHPLFLLNETVGDIMNMGYDYYKKYVPKEDYALLDIINNVGFQYMHSNIPIDERTSHYISYDFHIQQKGGKAILINHKLTPILVNELGQVVLALCVVSLSNHEEAGNIEIHKWGSTKYVAYENGAGVWSEKKVIKLTDNEIMILRLAIKGYTISEMSNMMFKSKEAIRSCRKKLFRKLGVDNMPNAIYEANNKGLL